MKVLRVRFKALQHMRDVKRRFRSICGVYASKKEALMKKFEAIYVYANQRYHEDTGNSFYQGLAGKAQTLSIQLDSAVVFEEPELLAIGKKTIDSWFTQNMDMQLYKRYFYELFRQQKHVLSKEEEAILADVSDMSADVSNIFCYV